MLATPAISDADGVSAVTENVLKGVLRQNSFSGHTEWAEAQAAAATTTAAAEASSPMAVTDAIDKGNTAKMEAAALNYGCHMEELTPLQLESVNEIAEQLESEVRAFTFAWLSNGTVDASPAGEC